MRLYLYSLGDFSLYYLDNEYIKVPRPMTFEKIKEKQEHNLMMIDLASFVSNGVIDDVKNYTNTNKIWDKLGHIHGGDKNMLRDKF